MPSESSAKQLRQAQKLLGKKKSECVRVYVRCRPLFGKELSENQERQSVTLVNPKTNEKKGFTFDGTMPPNIKQDEVYKMAAVSIVQACLEGYNGTIFAYGQTGAGKSHTMEGDSSDPALSGMYVFIIHFKFIFFIRNF
eukprot:GSMAST32.ASY1.ANO1.1129.1 assembled CDS